jgi:ribose-phosphate pyrophosphokinase
VLSPDEGSIKKALLYQKKLGGAIAIVDKRRSSATETRAANVIGASVEGKVVVIFDDMISTAGTVVNAAYVARRNGARDIYVCATHPVLCGHAIKMLAEAPIRQTVVTDSIPVPPAKHLPNLVQLSVAPLLANAIKRIHLNESVSKLFE